MPRTRSKEFRDEGILSVVFDKELGLCGWFGDERIDDAVYGFGPRQDFIRALEKEMKFQMRNMGGLGEHPILRRVVERFQQARAQIISDAFFSGELMISWSSKQHTLLLKFVAEKNECT